MFVDHDRALDWPHCVITGVALAAMTDSFPAITPPGPFAVKMHQHMAVRQRAASAKRSLFFKPTDTGVRFVVRATAMGRVRGFARLNDNYAHSHFIGNYANICKIPLHKYAHPISEYHIPASLKTTRMPSLRIYMQRANNLSMCRDA